MKMLIAFYSVLFLLSSPCWAGKTIPNTTRKIATDAPLTDPTWDESQAWEEELVPVDEDEEPEQSDRDPAGAQESNKKDAKEPRFWSY